MLQTERQAELPALCLQAGKATAGMEKLSFQ